MTTFAKPCIVCGRELENVTDDATNQPHGGTSFISHGHYGSTLFDPMDGSFIEINVCDLCLAGARDRDQVMIGRDSKPVMFENSVVGSCKTPGRPMMDWTGDEPTSYEEDPSNNIMHVDVGDGVLENPELYPEITFHVSPADLLGRRIDK